MSGGRPSGGGSPVGASAGRSVPQAGHEGVAARHRAPVGLLRASVGRLVELVLMTTCAGCGQDGVRWCLDCARLLGGPGEHRTVAGLPVSSAAVYQDRVRSAVVAWKDEGRADLTPVFARVVARLVSPMLAAAGERGGAGGDPSTVAAPGSGRCPPALPTGLTGLTGLTVVRPVLLVPAPSSARSRRVRGRAPAADLALACARLLRRRSVPVRVVPALRHRRQVQDQAGLDAAGRQANLGGALEVVPAWRGRLSGGAVMLLDDVVTTGATVAECARVLTAAGAAPVGAVTVAATPLRGSTSTRGCDK